VARTADGAAALLYDPDCGLCTASAAWLGRRVRGDVLSLVPLTDAPADPLIGPLVAGRDLRQTLHLVTADRRVLTGARAVVTAGRLVPRWQVPARLADKRPAYLVLEPLYRFGARHRRGIGRMLGVGATCPMPAPEERPQ
jgi:predicted DCC family thiol-disulfide oxidoreductase YuxK